MARRRLFVDSGIRPERVQPAANPVDSFVPQNGGGQLLVLAQSLSALSPSLARFAGVMADKKNDEQTALGEQKARELHEARMTFNDAIKSGVIEEHQSPFFMAAFKQQSGRLAAGDYDSALRVAMAEDAGLQDSTDLADFDEFESKFRKQWVAENVGDKNRDVQFESGFGRMIDGFTLDAKRQFSTAVAQRVKQQSGDNLQREIAQVLDRDEVKDRKSAVEQINTLVRSYLEVNPKGGKLASEKAVQAVIDYSMQLAQDDDPLAEATAVELLKEIDAGPGSKLYGLPKAKEMLAEARDKIFAERQARHRAQVADEEYQRTVESRSIYTDLNQALTSAGDPSKVDLKPFLSRMAVIDASPQARETLYKMAESFAAREYPVDDNVYADALMRVHGVHPEMPGFLSQRQAANLLAAKQVTPTQYNLLSNEIDQRDRQNAADAKEGSKLLNNRTYTLVSQMLRSSMVSDFDFNAEERAAANEAQIEFTKQFLQAASSGNMPTFDEAVKMSEAAKSLYGLQATLEARQGSQSTGHQRLFQGTEAGGTSTTETPDFNKAPVVSKGALDQIESDLRTKRLSPQTAQILDAFDLSTPEKIKAFLEAQRKLVR